MTSYNDLFVAMVAFVGGALALAVAIGPWQQPYHLRSISRVVDRYGMSAARSVWVLVAIISLIAGMAIASGVRPGFAKPDQARNGSAR
ncbi:hypothetical protein Enr13x_07530 [Stieleria neptunia]|uniref:Uncharacterized protein n=1 Tax=Stieleria neptunia TaxID=2527979 RepID=A0A518HJ87_9BACT|nr:hypothetical protein [Stieleria neptunia]QDV40916.1 hypothetical protein Enr13x_07530 [Stieleria neptunia]